MMDVNQAYSVFVVGGLMLVAVVACLVSMILDRWVRARQPSDTVLPLVFFPWIGIVAGLCVLLLVVWVLRVLGYDLPVFMHAAWASEVRR